MVYSEESELSVEAGYGALPARFPSATRSSSKKLLLGWIALTVLVATVVVGMTISQHQSARPIVTESPESSESAVALGARIRDLQSQITKISLAESLEKRLETFAREERSVSDRMYDEVEAKNRALENLVEKDQLAKSILSLQKRGKDKALENQLIQNANDEKDLKTLLESLQKEQLAASDLAAQSEALIHIANVGQQNMERADKRVDTELDKLKRLQDSVEAEDASIMDIEDQLNAMKVFLKQKDKELKALSKLTKEEKDDIKKDFEEWELQAKDFEAELAREKKDLEARRKLVTEQRKEVVKALSDRQLLELDNAEIVLEMENLIEGKTPEPEEKDGKDGKDAGKDGKDAGKDAGKDGKDAGKDGKDGKAAPAK